MNIKKITKIVTFGIIPLLFILILVYDVVAIQIGGTEASISSLIIVTAYGMPMLPFTVGAVVVGICMHLFWRMKGNRDTKEIDKGASDVK